MRYINILLLLFSNTLSAQQFKEFHDKNLHVYISLPNDSFNNHVINDDLKPLKKYYIRGYECFNLYSSTKITSFKKRSGCAEQIEMEFDCGKPGSLFVADSSIVHNVYAYPDSGKIKYRLFVSKYFCQNEHNNIQTSRTKLVTLQFFFYNKNKEYSLTCNANEELLPIYERLFFNVANSVHFDD